VRVLRVVQVVGGEVNFGERLFWVAMILLGVLWVIALMLQVMGRA